MEGKGFARVKPALGACRVPFYAEVKLIALLWLIAPQTRGAQALFETHIRPFLQQYAAHLDLAFAYTEKVT